MTQPTTCPAWTDQVGISPYISDKDFSLYETNGEFHWEGLADYEEYCSEDGFEDISDCISDCIYSLCRLDGDSDEDAALLIHELGLPTPGQETREYDFAVLAVLTDS